MIKKGTADGEKFDSKWEYIVWLYFKKIQCVPCERNRLESLIYYDERGKARKFFPDFKIAGRWYEVKGQYRPSDLKKLEQHPTVEFIDATNIGPYRKAVEQVFPNWEQDYAITN